MSGAVNPYGNMYLLLKDKIQQLFQQKPGIFTDLITTNEILGNRVLYLFRKQPGTEPKRLVPGTMVGIDGRKRHRFIL